ncbi:MAG: menaquinone biosynthesis protein [Proteobacteria bacterium]|nr:menaquinone biosynthesis protein [Pseudomonadota bacterium]MBU1710500.1 menaquinone biosynthesis protein [Pseudomonadota bacterium]
MNTPSAKIRARIGMVNFINTAPLYSVWIQTVNRPEWKVTEAPPTQLNRMLFEDELDLGFVSSHEYAIHPDQYKILSDLSISATGSVGSVFLFSKENPEKLTGKIVQLSAQSQTSVGLVKIILEEFYGQQPIYVMPSEATKNQISAAAGAFSPTAVLAIGDQALRMKQADEYPVQLDLGEIWKKHTGLPFVFAVWAVRRDFCRKDPDCVLEIHQELLRCVREGQQDIERISREAAPKIPMSASACLEYLKGLEYDLGPEKRRALELFFDYLIKRGEAQTHCLPITICG